MKNVCAILTGAPGDLEDLLTWLTVRQNNVRKEDGKYLLCSPLFETCSNPQELRPILLRLIEQINSAGKLNDPHFGGIYSTNITFEDDGGQKHHHAWIEPQSVVNRVKFGTPIISTLGVAPPPQPTFVEQTLGLMQRDHSVQKALQFLRLPEQTWGSLYSVFEIIREDLDPDPKNWRKLLTLGVTEQELDQFRETANSSEHTGLLARHGRSDKTMKYPAISPDQGERLIRNMLHQWIRMKLTP